MKFVKFFSLGLILMLSSTPLYAQSQFVTSPKQTKKSTRDPSPKQQQVLTPSQIYKLYDPAVVIIKLSFNGRYAGHGSGFLVKSNGFILTNFHVVDTKDFGDYADNIQMEVILEDGKIQTPRIIKTDAELDLALLKIDGNGLPSVNMGQVSEVQVGEDVVIIGTPIRLEFSHSLTKGVISGFNREGGRIQTSAIIHGGNSGGPAFNLKGEVIGIAVAVAAGEDRSEALVDQSLVDLVTQQEYYGITYLIPINFAKNLLNLMY